MIDRLFIEFPGTEHIAELMGISPTKLKMDFKKIHYKTLQQYYSHHLMKVAHK